MVICRQYQLNEDIDIHKIWSTVTVQCEDGQLWMHGTKIGHGSCDHNGRSYTVRVTKMGCTIARTKRHVKGTHISVEEYLINEVIRANSPQVADRLNELVDQFMQPHKHMLSNKTEAEEKDTVTKDHNNMPHITQPHKCVNLENWVNDANGSRTKNMHNTHQTPNWETNHYKIRKDKQETRETFLLGHSNIIQVGMFT